MSDQVWIIEKMFKHRLQVDFSRGTIECRGYSNIWTWNTRGCDFYEAFFKAISDIERASLRD